MSTITQIRIWRDTGFTDGCTEVPKKGGSLATPTYIFDGPFNPSKDDLFSRLKLRVPYTQLMDCSYLSISLDMKNGMDKTFYGWIDSVSIISDTESTPMTQVNWHVDLWRTYLSSATIGSGMVRRRPLLTGDSVPPQSYPVRYRTSTASFNLTPETTTYWVIFIASSAKFQGAPTITGAFPVSASSPSSNTTLSLGKAPSFNDLVTGTWDEEIGLDPASVYGVFLSPIAPQTGMSGWGEYANEYKVTSGESSTTTTYATYFSTSLNAVTQYSSTIETITPDDVDQYAIRGFDGEVIGMIPWGLEISSYTYRLVIDTTSAYLQIRFDGKNSHSEGLCFTIPLIPISLSSNAYSSYVYSGARQADIMQARAEAEKSRESALVGMASNVTSSVASSAMLGSLGGPVGTLGGALIGGASSIISGTIGAAADYAVTTKYNDVFQDITDYRIAHQSNGLIMSGTGFDSTRFGFSNITLVKLSADAYSTEQRTNDISLYGVHVSEPKDSCQSLIDAGGPVQIDNAVVTGSIPVEAKQYIRQRLSQGVRMI